MDRATRVAGFADLNGGFPEFIVTANRFNARLSKGARRGRDAKCGVARCDAFGDDGRFKHDRQITAISGRST